MEQPEAIAPEAGGAGRQRSWRAYLVEALGFAAAFAAAGHVSHWAWSRASVAYRALGAERQARFTTYMMSLLHATAIVGLSVVRLARAERPLAIPPTTSRRLMNQLKTFMLGYFLNDFWATRQDWRAHPDAVVHHLLALGILVELLRPEGRALNPYLPSFAVVELSTIVLNAMWILKELGRGGGTAYRVLSVVFAVLFVLLRCVWLPVTTICAERRKLLATYPQTRALLWLACALQWYWLALIVRKLQGGAA
jgi:hypothetical protein